MRGVEQIPWLYDALLWVAEARGLGRWRRRLVDGARGCVLDVGCGTGRNLPILRAQRLVGLDPSRDALRRAKRRAPGAMLVRGSAQAMPFRDRAFDTVVSGLVFCSVPDAGQGLEEVKRVLAPGGELRMMEHVRSTTRWVARLQDAIQPAWTWVAGGCRPNRDTESAVERAGFCIEPDRRAQGTMRLFRATPSD